MSRRRQNNTGLAEAFGDLRSDYQAARSSRFRRRRTGVSPTGSGADYHYRSESDYLRLMEQARDMDRNDVVVGQTVNRAVGNTIQDGIALDTQTGDPMLDADLAARWADWSEDAEQCDISGELNFHEMEELVFRHSLVDGDMIALPTIDGSLQLHEGHRLRTPTGTKRNVVHGVLLSETRKRLEYWLTRDEIDPNATVSRVNQIEIYPARDAAGHRQVFQIYDPKRVSQTRGVTAFAPIFDHLGMFEDINFAKLVQQQIVSCFAIFRTRQAEMGSISGDRYGNQENEALTDGTTKTIEGVGPGMLIEGRPGDTLQGFSPNTPNSEFFQHVKLMLTLIGINLGLPVILVTMDASDTNFSGWRGAVDQARMGFKRNQRWLASRFHKQVYLWKVRQWMADDPILAAAEHRNGINIFGHRWNPPTWPYIQPLQDAQADLLRDKNALISKRRLHAERGREWTQLATEIVEDNVFAIRLAKQAAAKLNSEFKDSEPVHWREIISLPTPDGVQVNVTPEPAATASTNGAA